MLSRGVQKKEVSRKEASIWESGSGGKNFPKVYQRSKWEGSLPSPSSSLWTNSDSNSDTDFPEPPPGGPEGPPPRPPPDDENEGEEPPPGPPPQEPPPSGPPPQEPPPPGPPPPGHLHQRSNLRRVQTKTHYPSNLKVIDRYDSSSLSIKGPNPTGLTL